MTRPQLQQHVPPQNPSIQQSIINKPHHLVAANHPSPILNQPNQIIEMINDSSSPPTPGEVPRPKNTFQLPPLLNNQPAQTAHTMSSDPQYQPAEPRRRPEEYIPAEPRGRPEEYQPAEPRGRPEEYQPAEPRGRPEEYQPAEPRGRPEEYQPAEPRGRPEEYQPAEIRRRPVERRHWQEPPRRPDGPASSHVFHLKQITVYSQPYSYTFNREPLYLQFGTHAAADAARTMQIGPPPGQLPGPYTDPRDRDEYRPYTPRNSRQFEEDRYEPYDGYQRNYEPYNATREYDRRGEAVRRSDEHEGTRYRHSTGQGEGPASAPGSAPGPSGAGRGHGGGQDDTDEYERDDESGEGDKRRQRLPATRTYRDFSHVPSMSGQSEERKRYSIDELRVKRARLNWSEDLHSKFLAAVEELGVENAVPTSIMKLMKVDGLTRENVASHLQKYRGTIKKEKEEQERRLLLKAAAKSVIEDGDGGKLTEEEVLKAVAEREQSYKAPAKKRGGKDR